jgi:membrane associated rhomboid family serine protease
VAHDAHFYGAVFGVLFTVVLDPRLITQIGYLQRSIGL